MKFPLSKMTSQVDSIINWKEVDGWNACYLLYPSSGSCWYWENKRLGKLVFVFPTFSLVEKTFHQYSLATLPFLVPAVFRRGCFFLLFWKKEVFIVKKCCFMVETASKLDRLLFWILPFRLFVIVIIGGREFHNVFLVLVPKKCISVPVWRTLPSLDSA